METYERGNVWDVETFERFHVMNYFDVSTSSNVSTSEEAESSCTAVDVETFWQVPTRKRFDVETFALDKTFPRHATLARRHHLSKRFQTFPRAVNAPARLPSGCF